MKGITSRDGKMSGNRQMVDRYDSTRPGAGKKPQRPGGKGGESGGAHEASGHDEIKKVVREHGPAHGHHVMKSEGGGYESTTHHEDGHVHGPISHGSIEEAHEHGAHAMDDADHLGDMPRDDKDVADEHDDAEGGGGMGGSNVGGSGFMA